MVDSTFITAAVQNVWNAWNIRGFMILSLCMQLILAFAAPFRKKTSNGFFVFGVWSAYLLADWSAIFAFGLISNAGCRNSAEVPQDVMAFWAAFLLVHLGGPDTITAFSLEDNALWLRHLVGLIAQFFAFLYIFAKTIPDNKLLVPTFLIFVSGVVKYGERTRALYLASLENLKKSIKKTPNLDDDINSHGEEDNDEENFPEDIRQAFHFHKIFKGLIVDIMPDLSEWKESREFVSQKDAKEVFSLITTELNFLYEVFYTKIMAENSGRGVLIRSIAYYSALAGFILFCLVDKDEFHGVDVAITYALLGGVFALDVASILMFAKSNWTNTNNAKYFVFQVFGQLFPYLVVVVFYIAMGFFVDDSAVEHFFDRLWSEKLDLFNLLSHCFKECAPRKCRKPGFMWEKLAEMRNTSQEIFDPELWGLIYEDVKRKAVHAINAEKMRRVHEARGDLAIEESGYHELMRYINDFQYDNTLLIWHVATEICYNLEENVGGGNGMKRFSKILSDYMMYLLVKQPKLMSPVAGIGHIRYEHTCFEAKLLGRKFGATTLREFCALILEEHANITEPDIEVKHYVHSVLNDACGLVRLLRENNDRWEIIVKVWIDMLAYAAGHCKVDSYTRLLSQGGEFVTFVWMLMAHYGIGGQFPIK